jgi:hypothetical protein
LESPYSLIHERCPTGGHFEKGGIIQDDPNSITPALDLCILRTPISIGGGGVQDMSRLVNDEEREEGFEEE